MDTGDSSWIAYIATALGSMGGLKLLEFFNNRNKVSQDGFEILRESWKSEFERLEAKIERMNQELGRREILINKMDIELTDLKTRMSIMAASTPSLPIPAWKKSPDGIMLGLNPAYEVAFLRPKGWTTLDYVGYTDEKIWGKEIADHFRERDIAAAESKEAGIITFEEHDDELLDDWVFLKYPEFIDGTLVSVSGVAVPKKDYVKNL